MKVIKYGHLVGLCFINFSCGSDNHREFTKKQQLNKFDYKAIYHDSIDKLIAKKKSDMKSNFEEELQIAKRSDNSESVRHVIEKYQILKGMFHQDAERVSAVYPGGVTFGLENSDTMDKPWRPLHGSFNYIYHPKVLAVVSEVFEDFGPLYIKETRNEDGHISAEVVETKRPWSAYWYPFKNKILYSDPDSVLAKYDRALAAINSKTGISRVAETESETCSKVITDGWEGRCDAWAFASVLVPEPIKPLEIHGIKFGISDLKALAIMAHSRYPYKQYGITYRGDADTDGTYQDIKPEAFHRIVTKVIGEQKKAIIIDEEAGPKIWNKPVYKYIWKVEKDPEIDTAYIIRMTVMLVESKSYPTSKVTGIEDIMAYDYKARLYVNKSVYNKSGYQVIAGQWLGDSRRRHPCNVKIPDENAEISSHNPEFNRYIAAYKKYFLQNSIAFTKD